MGLEYVDEPPKQPATKSRLVYADGGNEFGPKSGVLRQLADVPIGLVGGVAGLVNAGVGLGDIATGGTVGNAVDAAGSVADKISLPDALRPTRWQDKIQSYYSPEMKGAKAAAHQAAVDAEQQAKTEGADWKGQIGASALGSLKGIAENPRAGLAFVTENYGGMKAIAKGTEKVLGRYLPEIDAAVKSGAMTQAQADARIADLAGKISPVGEGILTAGQGAHQVREENPNATASDFLMQAPAGLITGAIARGVGKIPGLENAESTMALNAMNRQSGFTGNAIKRVGKGVLSEGVLQEVPQSAQEQAWVNAATGKPLQEGVGEAAVQGLVAGGALGGGAAGMSALTRGESPAPQTQPGTGGASTIGAPGAPGVPASGQPGAPASGQPASGQPAVPVAAGAPASPAATQNMAGGAQASQPTSPQALVAEALAVEQAAQSQEAAQAAATSNAPAGNQPSAAPIPQTNQAESAGAPIQPTERTNGSNQTEVTIPPGQGQQAQSAADAGAGTAGQVAKRADFYESLAAERDQTDPVRAAAYRAKAQAIRDGETDGNASLTAGQGKETGATLPKASKGWQAFPKESGTLGIPRAEMPQIKSEHRGALVQFLAARGVQHQQEEVAADSLRPTQAEFSPAKVKKATKFTGNNRSILVSADGHVLDGHHQWLASLAKGEPVKAIRLDAPIGKLVELAREFPSSTKAGGASNISPAASNIAGGAPHTPLTTPPQPTTNAGQLDQQAVAMHAPDVKDSFTTDKQSLSVEQALPKAPAQKSRQSPIQKRDDLIGAIMRVTGGDGIAANMALTIAGDTANRLPKVRGLFTNKGTADLGDVAMLLREEEGFDVRDGDHLSELVRKASAGDVAVSMERMQRDKDAEQERQHRDRIRARAKKFGVKTVAVKFSDMEANVLAVDQKRHDAAVAKLEARDKKRFDDAVAQSESLVSDAEIRAILLDLEERGMTGREKWREALVLQRQLAGEARHQKEQGELEDAESRATTEEPAWFKDFDEEGNRQTSDGGASSASNAADEGRGGEGQAEQGRDDGSTEPVRGSSETDSKSNGQEAGGELAGQTRAEIARQEADRVAAEKEAREAAAKEAKAKKDAEQKAIDEKVKARTDNPDNFVFGEDGKAAANPTGGLFDQPAVVAQEPVIGYDGHPGKFGWAENEVGGAVVYSSGDIALVEGFSPLGNAVYAGVKGESRTRADISAYTGKMFSETEKAELEKAKADHVKEQGRLHEKAPEGPFSNGARFAKSESVSDELAGVAQKWLGLMGIKSRVFLATKGDVSSKAAIDRYGLRGPFSAVRSAGTQNDADGSKRTLPNGDHYIILPRSARKSQALEALAHEIGHILEADEWSGADRATKDAVMADYQKWLNSAGNTKAADWVKQLRAHTSGKLTHVATSETADRLPPYWRSFSEYFADQVSRWATTTDRPLTAVDAFFRRIALAMRRLYAKAAGKSYLPGPAMKAYLDSRALASPLELPSAPAEKAPATPQLQPAADASVSAESLKPLVSGGLNMPLPKYFSRAGKRSLYKIDEAIDTAKSAGGSTVIADVEDHKNGRGYTPEIAMLQLENLRGAVSTADGKLASNTGNGRGVSPAAMLSNWIAHEGMANAIAKSRKDSPAMWKAYDDRQSAVRGMPVGGMVHAPYPNPPAHPLGSPAKIVAKFKNNWRIEEDGRHPILVPPSALRPFEQRSAPADSESTVSVASFKHTSTGATQFDLDGNEIPTSRTATSAEEEDLGAMFDDAIGDVFGDQSVAPAKQEPAPPKPSFRAPKSDVHEQAGPGTYGNYAAAEAAGSASGEWYSVEPAPSNPGRNPLGQWVMKLDKPKAARAPSKKTAASSATSAAKNAGMGLSEVAKGLNALFKPRPGTLGSGPSFDEKTYEAAKPYFIAGIQHFKQAGADVADMMRALVTALRDQFGMDKDTAMAMKPYVVKFMGDVKAGRVAYDEAGEPQNGEGGDRGTESEGDGALAPVVADEVGGTGEGGQGGRGTVESGQGSGEGNTATDAGRGEAPRSGGNGSAGVHPSDAGGSGPGPGGRGTGGTGGTGSEVSLHLRGRAESRGRIPEANFEIGEDVGLGEGGQAGKYKDNVAAIKVLKAIEADRRRATAEEKKVLARYVGWGGIPNAFKNRVTGEIKTGWSSQVAELESLLTKDELRAASASTRNAHFTSKEVVGFMWQAARRLGFNGGMVLEPSVGTGNFIGLIPREIAGKSLVTGIELDSLTSRMARALYPRSNVVHSGFEKLALPDGGFSLAIGNPPFGAESLRFQHRPDLNRFSIHNQFFLGSLDAVEPGGLMAMVVSRYLLDAQDASTRRLLAQKAKLVGAVRLPGSAFKGNALTDVVTDVIFLQRRTAEEEAQVTSALHEAVAKAKPGDVSAQARKAAAETLLAREMAWTGTAKVKDPLGGEAMEVGAYFAANPQMIAGTMDRSGSMQHGADIDVKLAKGEKLAERLAKAIEHLPARAPREFSDEALARSEEMHAALGEALALSASGAEVGSLRFEDDGALTTVVERLAENGESAMKKVAVNAATPWSPNLFMDMKGRWFSNEPKLKADGTPMKNGRFVVYTKKVYENEADIPAGLRLGESKFERLKKLVTIRDLFMAQINLEVSRADKKPMEAHREKLRRAYDAFVKDHGYISENRNASIVSEMPDEGLLLSLESDFRPAITAAKAKASGVKQAPATAKPSAILSRPVAVPPEAASSAASAADALAISLSESGRISLSRIADLLDVSQDEAKKQLTAGESPLAFADPEQSGEIVERNAYLSGSVRRKLEAAKEAGLAANVAALEKVQPEQWTSDNVNPRIGANWIPTAVYADFASNLLGSKVRVSYSEITNTFDITGESDSAAATATWGTARAPFPGLFSDMLNSSRTAIYDPPSEPDGRRTFNQAETDSAADKKRDIAEAFDEWVFKDSARRQELTQLFNDRFNTRVNRQYDGSHLTMPGKVPDDIISLRRSQKNGAWRGIIEPAVLYDHAVGAGKTFTALARAIERRRMGISKKPMIVVPNHMVSEWATQAYRLYPGAKILAAGAKDLSTKNRRRLFAKIASGDWDAVIVPHSSFGFISVSPATEERFLNEQIELANAALKEAEEEADPGSRFKPLSVKAAEALVDKLEKRITKVREATRDKLLTFEQMGVDDLTVDEAHEFKNLFYSTRMTDVRGLGPASGSNKALDLYTKARVIREMNGGLAFLSGTPISNSAVEMYTLTRYLAPETLADAGLEHFDAFRAQFVNATPELEPTDSGVGLKLVTRLGRSWSNMRSLMEAYYSVADVVTNDDIKAWYAEDNPGQEFPLPKVKGGDRRTVSVPPTPTQLAILLEVVSAFDTLKNIQNPKERNATRLRLMDRARKLSLHAKAVDRSINDEPGGKLDRAADEVAAIFHKWTKDKGTQLVFLDRGLPKGKGDSAIIKSFDALQAASNEALSIGDEAAYGAAQDKLAKFDANEIEEMRAAQEGGWNAYQHIKDGLIARGVPANTIAFIQDHHTDAAKKQLFEAVKDGAIRVLIGSTPRMGAGMNVQERLVALHHIDATWKPSDIEQREGRIIRQGNALLEKYGKNFEVEIIAYVTERTVDAKLWSLNSMKLKMVNAIRYYDGQFEMNFEDDAAVGMAETAALASGDPLLLERFRLESEVNTLLRQKKAHSRRRQTAEDSLESAHRVIDSEPWQIEKKAAEAKVFDKAQEVIAADLAKRKVEINGEVFGPSQHYSANKAIADAVAGLADGQKLAMTIDGEEITTKGAAETAVAKALGDSTPFVSESGGTRIITRSDFARVLRGVIGHEFKETPETAIGSIAGIPVTLSSYLSAFRGDKLVTLSSADGSGASISVSVDVTPENKGRKVSAPAILTVQNLRPLVVEFEKRLSFMERNDEATNYIITRAKKARESIPALEAVIAEPFKHAEELEQKKARLADVEKELDGRTSADVAKNDRLAEEGGGGGVVGNLASASNVSPADSAIYDMAVEGKPAAEILEFIGQASRRPFNQYLARALKNLGVSSTVKADEQSGWNLFSQTGNKYGAAYNNKTDTVALFERQDAEHHILHEFTHAATLKAIAKGGPAATQMNALFEHVQADGSLDGQYGMSLNKDGTPNIKEFVAEAFSNPKFQIALKSVPAPRGSSLKNAWQAFVRMVARMLGFKSPQMENALDRAMVLGAQLMRENAALSGNTGEFSPNNQGISFNAAAGTNPQPVASRNAWQKAKAKAAALLTPERIDKVIYELQDKYIDLRRLRDHIKQIGGVITDMNDAYLGEELYHKRVAHRTESFMADEIKPLLAEMHSNGVGQDEFETFLHARHAPEANAEMAKRNPNQNDIDAGQAAAAAMVRQLETQLQHAQAAGTATAALERSLNDARGELSDWNGAQAFQGTEDERRSLSGMSDAAAAAVMSSLSPAKRAKLDALAARVDAINAGTIKLLDDYGLMSKDALRAWKATYKHYIPLHRDEAHPDSNSHPIGQGFSTKGDAAKRRTGSNAKVTNILGHIAMQRESALTRGEKNHVMLKLYLMARQNPLPDVWKVGAVPMLDTIDKKTGFVKSVPDPLYKNRPNVVMLRIAGKDVAIAMNENNPEALRMAQALKNLDVDDLHYLIPAVGKITRYFASINTQYNPIFGLVNLMRDTQEAALNLSTTELAGKQGEVFRDTLSILKEVLKNKGRMPQTGKWADLFHEMKEVGGTTGYRDLFLDPESRSKALLSELKALDRGRAGRVWHVVTSWLSDYNEAMENATRLAAYKAAVDNGMSKERAASLAKNLTVNFNRKGRQTREIGALYAFFNAAVQGTTRMAKTLSGPAGRKIMAGGVMLGAMNALIGFAAMGGGDDGDDEWEKIPEFVKERSIIIPIGKQDYITIPMPLGFQFLPNIGRLAVEMALYKDKTAGKQFASLFGVLANTFNPLGGSAPLLQVAMPTVVDPFVALAQNTDWTGKPIYRENLSGLDPDPGFKLAKDSATPIAKGVAEAINYITGGTDYTPGGWSPTPDQIDYLVGQLTGGVGRELGKATSTIAAPLTGEELPAYKIPLVGRLYGNTSGASGESQKFYENVTRANEAENEIKGRLKAGLSVADYLRENPAAMAMAAQGNAAERQASLLRSIRRGIVEQDPPDKAARVREINNQVAAVMRGFNRSAAAQ